MAPSTSAEIYSIICTFENGKSLGPNSIPMKLLKTAAQPLSSILNKIINQSFKEGIFPEKMKWAGL